MFPEKINFEDALKLAYEGFRQHRDSVTGYTIWAGAQGINAQLFRMNFFVNFHKIMLRRLKEIAPALFQPDLNLRQAFEISRGRIKNGIATHACAQNWALPILNSKDIAGYFEPGAILGLSDSNFLSKAEHPDLVRLCFDKMGIDINEGGFVEDTLKNLETAKAHYPRLVTIFLHHGNPLPSLPIHVDAQFRDIPEMKRAIHASWQYSQP